jgi:hypothetical protein
MRDEPRTVYGWADDVKYQMHDNPDYFAIVAAVIELLRKEGKQYKIKADGTASRRKLRVCFGDAFARVATAKYNQWWDGFGILVKFHLGLAVCMCLEVGTGIA